MSAAQSWDETQHPRESAGRFARKPDRAGAAGGFDVDDGKGTLAYPDPRGFDGTPEDFLDFFESAPLSDEFIREANRAYTEVALPHFKAARQSGWNAPSQYLPERWAQYAKDNPDGGYKDRRDTTKGEKESMIALRSASQDEAERQFREEWPYGPNLQPHEARRVVRAIQARRSIAILDEEQQRRALYLLPFPHDAEDGKSVVDIVGDAKWYEWAKDGFL